MQLSDLMNLDIYKGVIPLEPEIGKLHIYPIGLVGKDDLGINLPEHEQMAMGLGIPPDQVEGCYTKLRSGQLFYHQQACGSVNTASPETFRLALANGVVILAK